jgi:gamma-glutamyltranspeptidase/glutathione hydrolase
MPIQEAIEAPRISLNAEPNFYMPGAEVTIALEGRVAPQVIQKLQEMGHLTRVVDEYSQGNMQGIYFNQEAGTMMAGADARRTMYAVGF